MPIFFKPDGAPPVILASASEARAKTLRAAGIDVLIQPAAIDEDEVKSSFKAAGAAAGDAAIALAELKAGRIASAAPESAITLGADQILTCDGRWFDKPEGRDAAREQLLALAGKAHELESAVAAFRGGAPVWRHLASARLWMRPLSADFIDAYLDAAGEAALGSVGCYQLEGLGAQLFSRIEGDYFGVLGMPLLPVLAFLRDQGAART